MHYLLYIPNLQGCSQDRLVELGLRPLIEQVGPEWKEVEEGPDGNRGMLLTWVNKSSRYGPKFDPENQTWTPAPATAGGATSEGDYWIGQYTGDNKPSPSDLAHRNQFQGLDTTLADGNTWTIPVARKLPHRHALNPETGEHRRVIDSRYAMYWEVSTRTAIEVFRQLEMVEWIRDSELAGEMPADTAAEVTVENAWDFVCQALSINYRLTPAIISELGLIDDSAMISCVIAALELPIIQALGGPSQKKNLPSPISVPLSPII